MRANTFAARRDLYVLFVALDLTHREYGPAWFIPSLVFAEVPLSASGARQFRAAVERDDEWADCRCSLNELPNRIMSALAAL